MQEAVEDGGGDGGVVEDVAPVGDVAVGGQDDRAVLVAARDDLEEVAGGLVGHRQVAELVDDQLRGSVEHNGGIRFRAGGTSVSLRNFTYTIGRRSTLSAQVGSSRLTILNLNLGKAEVGGDGPLTKTASGIRATLTAGAARALNHARSGPGSAGPA